MEGPGRSPETATTRRAWLTRGAALAAGCATAAMGTSGLQGAPRAEEARKPSKSVLKAAKKGWAISLNTSTLRGFKLPIEKTIEIAAGAGYRGIEPWPNEIGSYIERGGKLSDLRKRLEDKGLAVTGAIAFFRWMVDDDSERRRALEEAKRQMDHLAQIGGTHIAAPPTGKVEGISLARAAERYRDLLVASEDFPVIPAVEVWGFQKNLNRLGEAVYVAIESQHPRACVLPDVYHLYKGGSGLSGIGLLGKKLLAGCHLNDYPDIPREKIADKDRVHCGDGVADLDGFFRDLWQTGYRGPLSIELFNPEYWKQDPLEVARTSLEKTERAIGKALASQD